MVNKRNKQFLFVCLFSVCFRLRWNRSRVSRTVQTRRELGRPAPDFHPDAQLRPHAPGGHLVVIAAIKFPRRNGLS